MTTREPEWMRLPEAIARYDRAIGYVAPKPEDLSTGSELERIHSELSNEMNAALTRAGASGEIQFRGTPMTGLGHNKYGTRADIPTEYFRVIRSFCESNEILSWSLAQTRREAENAYAQIEGHPNWTDVVLHRASFEDWLKRWLKDWLQEQLKFGRIELDTARARASMFGIQSLEGNPATDNFDAMAEAFWTPAMAVAWLAWKSPDKVRERWWAYKSKCNFFHRTEWHSGFDDEIHEGWVLDNSPRPSVVMMLHKKELSARGMLKKYLEQGTLVATGVSERGGKRVEIPAREWQDLEFFLEHGSDVARAESTLAAGYEAITVASASVIALCAASAQMEGMQPSPADGGVGQEDEPAAEAAIEKKPGKSAAAAKVKSAVEALWPNGIPAHLQIAERDRQINAWCRAQVPPLASISASTIFRTLRP